MAITRNRDPKGRIYSYTVRYPEGGKSRSKTFRTLRDAQACESKLRDLRRLGEMGLLDGGRQTLSELHDEWWEFQVSELERNTRDSYDTMWKVHIEPILGEHRLNEITVDSVEVMVRILRKKGVGESSISRSLVILGAMIQRAVVKGKLVRNPVRFVTKPKPKSKRSIRALAPSGVEGIRRALGQRDATIVSVLAYAGLRPGECWALTWGDVRESTIAVDKAAAYGEIKSTKTGKRRTVTMRVPLKADLLNWKMASGRPSDDKPVFPDRRGGHWNDATFRNWRKRTFAVAAPEGVTPYSLRHSFVSLLIAEGRNILEIAGQAGHAPSMSLDVYGSVLDEFRGRGSISAEAEVLAARNSLDTVATPTVS